MAKELLAPDYIFEASWEVCNKVGGIYTVLSTRAKTLQEAFKDKVFFIGPDFWAGKENPLFSENENLCAAFEERWTESSCGALEYSGRAYRYIGGFLSFLL